MMVALRHDYVVDNYDNLLAPLVYDDERTELIHSVWAILPRPLASSHDDKHGCRLISMQLDNTVAEESLVCLLKQSGRLYLGYLNDRNRRHPELPMAALREYLANEFRGIDMTAVDAAITRYQLNWSAA